MARKKRHFIALIALFGVFSWSFAAQSQEIEDEDTIYPDDDSVPSVKCIRPKMIKTTRILDERNILFYMRGNRVYRNVLPRACRQLRLNHGISYNSTYGRLCDIDKITVVGTDGLLSSGWRCDLGKFYPLTEEEHEALWKEYMLTEELGLEKEPEA